MSTLKKRYESPPPAGETLADEGFDYTVLVSAPHTNRDGTESALITWQGQCAECGEMFSFKTGASVRSLPRRCPAHSKGKGWNKVQPFRAVRAATPRPTANGWTTWQEEEVAAFLSARIDAAIANNDRAGAKLLEHTHEAWLDLHPGVDSEPEADNEDIDPFA